MPSPKPATPSTRAPWIAFGVSMLSLATFLTSYVAVNFIPERDKGNISLVWFLSILCILGGALAGAARMPRSNPKWPAIACIAAVPLLMVFFGVLYLLKQMS